jgi:hypothetical protein
MPTVFGPGEGSGLLFQTYRWDNANNLSHSWASLAAINIDWVLRKVELSWEYIDEGQTKAVTT